MIRRILQNLKRKHYTKIVRKTAAKTGTELKVNYRTTVTKNTWLGNNVNFNGMQIKGQGKVIIGDYFHSGPDCLMITSFHNYDDGKEIPYDETVISKDIEIGNCVWIGERVIILGGAKIGEGAVIQAGSVVVDEIPPYAVAGGHPAKVFKMRDIEHYNKLKSEGKFH